jgi:hypothetical protein
MFPFYLSVVTALYLLFVTHLVLFPKSEAKLKLTLKVNGIILAVLGLIGALLIGIYVGAKIYSSFILGNLSALFPLDYFLFDLLVIGIGGFLAYRGFKFPANPERIYFPYAHGLVRKIFGSFFRSLFALIALYFFGVALLAFGIANYGSATWWCMLGLWLLLLTPTAYLFYHDFFWKNGREKTAAQERKTPLYILIGSSLLTLYFLIGLLTNKTFIVEDATAFFPVDFMKSINLVPYLVSLMAVLPPLIAFLFTFKKKALVSEPASDNAK